ncbi:hypothetical protein VNO77_09034 [Canavalia gladiata]|uniref:Uncharacterized protein n=1 Tax=Canavalia gladiata TaxID=3824 RepID=A0AAN9M8W5_CANGL
MFREWSTGTFGRHPRDATFMPTRGLLHAVGLHDIGHDQEGTQLDCLTKMAMITIQLLKLNLAFLNSAISTLRMTNAQSREGFLPYTEHCISAQVPLTLEILNGHFKFRHGKMNDEHGYGDLRSGVPHAYTSRESMQVKNGNHDATWSICHLKEPKRGPDYFKVLGKCVVNLLLWQLLIEELPEKRAALVMLTNMIPYQLRAILRQDATDCTFTKGVHVKVIDPDISRMARSPSGALNFSLQSKM